MHNILGAITFKACDIHQPDKETAQFIRRLEAAAFDPARQFTAFPCKFAHLCLEIVPVSILLFREACKNSIGASLPFRHSFVSFGGEGHFASYMPGVLPTQSHGLNITESCRKMYSFTSFGHG